jgi:predicted nuclease of predicted toxin-antitoxin system
MALKILVDMNLSPIWVQALEDQGWPSLHWSSAGAASAPDAEIMAWARERDYVVFTHDLDFGTTLAHTRAHGPSVLQIRAQDILPNHLESLVCAALREHEADLERGAIVVVDENRTRVRILPIRPVDEAPRLN